MAIGVTIDWATYVINVPRNGMTLVQSVPTEIRELNINTFRLELKDIEDSIPGMPQPDTHSHNTEVSLGGVTYARVVEILDPYSITFENEQYAVNLVGANSNIGDKVNVNQVSVRSNNSAGLISSPDIEFASFNGGVMINVDTGVIGTAFPTGTQRQKSNNISDTLLIANYRGFRKIYVDSDLTLTSDAQFDTFILIGQSHINIQLIIESGASVQDTIIVDCEVSGTLDGNNELRNCIIGDISYLNGHIHGGAAKGKITLNGGNDAYISNLSQLDYDIIPEIDLGGDGQNLILKKYSDTIKLTNFTGTSFVSAGLDYGTMILDSTTVISGTIKISGIGILVDENDNIITSGTWNGGVTIENRLINDENMANAVWDKTLP